MKKCLIVGKPNVGKTLFLIHFGEYLGLRNIKIKHMDSNGRVQQRQYTIESAKKSLSSSEPFRTESLQSIELEIPILKGKKKVEIIDSSGLIDGIHQNVIIRRGMAQTLSAMKESDIILHMIDISSYGADHLINGLGKTDYQLAQYGLLKEGYVILANKMDLLENKSKIIQLQKEFPQHYVIPVSALTGQGFDEVKTYVSRRI